MDSIHTAVRHVVYDKDSGKFSVTVEHCRTISSYRAVRLCGRGVGTFLRAERAAFPRDRDLPRPRAAFARLPQRQRIHRQGLSSSAPATRPRTLRLQCHKYGAKSVTTCWRTQPMGFKWPKTMDERPLLTKIDGKTVHFKDGSSKEYDAIILCTGYKHHFPFLDDDLRLRTHNRMHPRIWTTTRQ